ncbi:MAG: sugar transferase [Planctomycetaceae bacterium]
MQSGNPKKTASLRFSEKKRTEDHRTEPPETQTAGLMLFDPEDLPDRSQRVQSMDCRLRTPLSRLIKRSVDLTLSVPVVVLALPALCVVVRAGQWAQSSGPLFYHQKRCGQDGREFTILKFRTMNVPSHSETGKPEPSDARIFPMGSFLRRSKLDEIPQFVNVLWGTMSIVGPRPHHFEDCRQFEAAVQDYAHRTIAKPGITGLAQYLEFKGAFEWNCTRSRVEQDLQYIQNWTPALDIKLIAMTAATIARRAIRAVLRRLHRPAMQEPAVLLKIQAHESQLNNLPLPAASETARKAA